MLKLLSTSVKRKVAASIAVHPPKSLGLGFHIQICQTFGPFLCRRVYPCLRYYALIMFLAEWLRCPAAYKAFLHVFALLTSCFMKCIVVCCRQWAFTLFSSTKRTVPATPRMHLLSASAMQLCSAHFIKDLELFREAVNCISSEPSAHSAPRLCTCWTIVRIPRFSSSWSCAFENRKAFANFQKCDLWVVRFMWPLDRRVPGTPELWIPIVADPPKNGWPVPKR